MTLDEQIDKLFDEKFKVFLQMQGYYAQIQMAKIEVKLLIEVMKNTNNTYCVGKLENILETLNTKI
jgi:hypothetical protein